MRIYPVIITQHVFEDTDVRVPQKFVIETSEVAARKLARKLSKEEGTTAVAVLPALNIPSGLAGAKLCVKLGRFLTLAPIEKILDLAEKSYDRMITDGQLKD